MYIYTYKYIYLYRIYEYIYVCIYAYTYIYIYTYIYVYMYICIHMRICMQVYIYIMFEHAYTCKNTYMLIYMNRLAHAHVRIRIHAYKQVQPLDRLVSVQTQNVEQMPLSQVRELVSGMEGSSISLGFIRSDTAGRYNQRFVTTMTRTSSELQDVQLAIYEDLLKLMRSGDRHDHPEAIYQEILRNNSRSPDSIDGKLWYTRKKSLCC